tara:strand:- start:85 stop:318 length:234 start_codon:yes stop_codon:yes gene_type:complete
MIKWSYDEEITAEEFIRRIQPIVCDPVSVMMECDGDMWLSDYSKLVSAFWHLKNAVDNMDNEEDTLEMLSKMDKQNG